MKNNKMTLGEFTECMQTIAPLRYAGEWDNVGLLIEPLGTHAIERVLLTIDLTEDVVSEAVKMGAQAIVSYHPIMFSPIQSLSRSSHLDRTVMELVKNDIAVYSPHTALDAVPGGVNDWLATAVGIGRIEILQLTGDVGPGRLVGLEEPVGLKVLEGRIKEFLGLSSLRTASASHGVKRIERIALCAGAGGDVLRAVHADLYLTGEMRHHDVLAATQNGVHVILCEHTNSERGYLPILAKRITEIIRGDVQIVTAKTDRDPFDKT